MPHIDIALHLLKDCPVCFDRPLLPSSDQIVTMTDVHLTLDDLKSIKTEHICK